MKDKPSDGGGEFGSNGHNHDPEGPGNVGRPVEAEPVEAPRPERIAHLTANRHLIIKRSLLASALGGVIPIPVVDEYVAGRVRAGLLLKLAEQRQVDMLPSSAELMGDPREGSALRHATITAITLVALKLAWRKFFALLALGRGAEEMAITFQFATLFDHYCSRMHVGGRIERDQAAQLRKVIHATIGAHEKSGMVAIFRDAGRILGRSALEAPAWMRTRFAILAQRWISTRGDVDATLNPNAPGAAGPEGADAQWLDKAADSVETRLGASGEYLAALLTDFERRWAEVLATPPPLPKPTAA